MPHIPAMPTLKDFGGFKIVMYFEDHNPPHVHVIGRDFQALVRIQDAEVLEGAIPTQHKREALGWISENRESLEAKWDEYN
jgi:Domain of unknown function (DUF4160)